MFGFYLGFYGLNCVFLVLSLNLRRRLNSKHSLRQKMLQNLLKHNQWAPRHFLKWFHFKGTQWEPLIQNDLVNCPTSFGCKFGVKRSHFWNLEYQLKMIFLLKRILFDNPNLQIIFLNVFLPSLVRTTINLLWNHDCLLDFDRDAKDLLPISLSCSH